jgi:hypothetical protein
MCTDVASGNAHYNARRVNASKSAIHICVLAVQQMNEGKQAVELHAHPVSCSIGSGPAVKGGASLSRVPASIAVNSQLAGLWTSKDALQSLEEAAKQKQVEKKDEQRRFDETSNALPRTAKELTAKW